jgi:hypothetical protein
MIEWLKQMAEETIMTLTQTDDTDTTTQARHRRTGALGTGLSNMFLPSLGQRVTEQEVAPNDPPQQTWLRKEKRRKY